MKLVQSISIGTIAVATLLVGSLLAQAADTTTYKARPGGKITIDGTSTIHDWTVETRIIGGSMEISSAYPLDTSVEKIPELTEQPKVKVIVPVTSLKSGKNPMDEIMYDAMNSKKHRLISYELTKMTPSETPRKAGDPLSYDTVGKLTINGVTKEVKFPVFIKALEKERLQINGKATVKMTDFSIAPPAPKVALGLIKTGDDVLLGLEWIVAKVEKK